MKSALNIVIQDMFDNGYDTNRDRKNNFEAMIDGQNDPMLDAIVNILIDEYDYTDDVWDIKDLETIVSEICKDVYENN